MTALAERIAALQVEEPSWLFPDVQEAPVAADEATTFLLAQEEEDFGVFTLAYGFGMRLGAVAQGMHLDPAIVMWRVRRALSRWAGEGEGRHPGSLERGITTLLRGGFDDHPGLPTAPGGRASWHAAGLLSDLDASTQARLAAHLEPEPEEVRSGIGIGSVVLILAAVTGFIVFGLIRDVNPMWRGNALMQQGRFSAARDAFSQMGAQPEAQRQIALCWLGEGDFDKAAATLDRPEVAALLGSFGPREAEPPAWHDEPGGDALLPRGPLTRARPSFVVRAGPPRRLELRVAVGTTTMEKSWDLPDTRGGPDWVEVPFPADWPSLVAGTGVWTVSEGGAGQASFQLLEKSLRQEIVAREQLVLGREVPRMAKVFLRGHYYRNKGLLQQAAEEFATLAREFPEEAAPRRQLEVVAGALGVDPAVFLR